MLQGRTVPDLQRSRSFRDIENLEEKIINDDTSQPMSFYKAPLPP